MEEEGKEWEMEEHRSDIETSRGKVSWVLDRGMWFGKKLLYTGFVISSAPLTLPPLLVVSAIGLVVSIPSGMFLASYFCSENLMRKLLPIPDSEEGKEREELEHRGLKRKIESGEFGDGNDEEEEEVIGVVIVEESEGLEGPVVIEEIVVEEFGEPGNGDEEVVVQVTTVVTEERENGDEEREIEAKAVNEEKTTSKGDQSAATTTTKDDQSAISTSKDDQSTVITTKDDQTAVNTAKDDPSAFTTTSEIPTEETKDQTETSSEKPVQTTSEAKKKKNGKKKPASQQTQPQKVVYKEEKIWEQIEGVRKILGYRVKAQKSTVDELKALYVFTGVEPPETFTEPSDLADVNKNLQFLKSIIGVN